MHQYNTKKKKGKKKANSLYLVLGRQIDKTRQDKTGSLIRNNKNHYNYNRHRDEEEEEQKTKKREKYLILYIKICIHTSYHIIYSFLFIPHPSSLIPLSLSLSSPPLSSFSFPFIFSRRIHTLRPILRTKRHLNRFGPNSSRNQSLSHFRQTRRSSDL